MLTYDSGMVIHRGTPCWYYTGKPNGNWFRAYFQAWTPRATEDSDPQVLILSEDYIIKCVQLNYVDFNIEKPTRYIYDSPVDEKEANIKYKEFVQNIKDPLLPDDYFTIADNYVSCD